MYLTHSFLLCFLTRSKQSWAFVLTKTGLDLSQGQSLPTCALCHSPLPPGTHLFLCVCQEVSAVVRGVEGMLVKSGEVPWVSVPLAAQAVAQPSPIADVSPCGSLNLASFEESWAMGESGLCLSSRSEPGSSSDTQGSCKASMWLPCPLDILQQLEGHSAHSTWMDPGGCSYLLYHPAWQKSVTGPPRVPETFISCCGQDRSH